MEIQLQIWRSILRELCLLRLKMESSRGIQEIPSLSWSVGESPLKERPVILDTEYRVNNGTNAWDWKHSVQRDLWVVWCCHPARPGAKKKLLSFSNLLRIWPESWSCQIHIVKSLPPMWLFWNGACKNRRKRQWCHKDGVLVLQNLFPRRIRELEYIFFFHPHRSTQGAFTESQEENDQQNSTIVSEARCLCYFVRPPKLIVDPWYCKL